MVRGRKRSPLGYRQRSTTTAFAASIAVPIPNNRLPVSQSEGLCQTATMAGVEKGLTPIAVTIKQLKLDFIRATNDLDRAMTSSTSYGAIPPKSEDIIDACKSYRLRPHPYTKHSTWPELLEFNAARSDPGSKYEQKHSAYDMARLERQRVESVFARAEKDIAHGNFACQPDCPSSLMQVSSEGTSSARAWDNVTPITLESLTFGSFHAEYYVLLRILTPPFTTVGYTFIASDPTGHSTVLQFDDLVETPVALGGPSYEDVCTLYPIGTIVAVKGVCLLVRQPENRPVIDVTNPHDWRILYEDDPMLSGVTWKEADGSEWRYKAPRLGFQALRELGNKLFTDKKYLQAHAIYSQCIRQEMDHHHPLFHLVVLNRATTRLHLERYEGVLRDASAVAEYCARNTNTPDLIRITSKAFNCIAQAFIGLRRWENAMETYKSMLRLNHDPTVATRGIALMRQRLEEVSSGKYDFVKLYKMESKDRRVRLSIGDYVGPMEIVQHPTHGRALRSTKDLKIGTVILVTATQAYATPHDSQRSTLLPMFMPHGRVMPTVSTMLRREVAYKLLHNWAFCQQIHELYAGPPYKTPESYPLVAHNLGRTTFDTLFSPTRVQLVISRNGFKLGSRDAPQDYEQASGLFGPSSLFINNCVPNCRKFTIANIQVWCVAKDVPAGTILSTSYGGSLNHTQRTLGYKESLDFKCDCDLCVAERLDGEYNIVKRERLLAEIKALSISSTSVEQIAVKIGEIGTTYGPHHDAHKPDLSLALAELARLYAYPGVQSSSMPRWGTADRTELATRAALAALASACATADTGNSDALMIRHGPKTDFALCSSPIWSMVMLHAALGNTALAKAWLDFERESTGMSPEVFKTLMGPIAKSFGAEHVL